MKVIKTKLVNQIGVRVNTTRKDRDQWAQIVCQSSGKVRHTGQPKYIRYVARKRYNTHASA